MDNLYYENIKDIKKYMYKIGLNKKITKNSYVKRLYDEFRDALYKYAMLEFKDIWTHDDFDRYDVLSANLKKAKYKIEKTNLKNRKFRR